MSAPATGRIVRLADDVNTDVLLPGPYLNLTDPEELGRHLLEGYDPELGAAVAPGDVLLAGRNFGSGSSREQAPVAMLARGVQSVVAASFSRIFLRNAINLGLTVIESPEAWGALAHGDVVRVDAARGTIHGPGGAVFTTPPPPPFIAELRDAGGIEGWTRRRLATRTD